MNSKIAFSTYHISEHNPEHIQAIKSAIEAGVRLIDTSTNYMDGGAERAVAIAVNDLDDTLTCKLEIVSKFGYLQGAVLKRVKEDGENFKETVKYNEHVYHCIHPDFLKDQLSESLSRLHVDKIDCYLIHNPEYYFLDALNRDIEYVKAMDGMFERIYKAFVALELEVKAGRISSYGISSNSFSKAVNDIEFLPYEDLIIFAQNAAKEAENTEHSFTTVQLPVNILEQEGLKCASWAKENGLRVIVNRPLNAQKDNLMYRLADYDEPPEYYHHLNSILELLEDDSSKSIYNLIEQLDSSRHKFGWIGEYESFLYREIVPHLSKALHKLDDNTQEVLAQNLDAFLQQYKKMVAYECSKNTKIMLKNEFKNSNKRLQTSALEFLLQKNEIDYVSVGMRKPSYVADVINLV